MVLKAPRTLNLDVPLNYVHTIFMICHHPSISSEAAKQWILLASKLCNTAGDVTARDIALVCR